MKFDGILHLLIMSKVTFCLQGEKSKRGSSPTGCPQTLHHLLPGVSALNIILSSHPCISPIALMYFAVVVNDMLSALQGNDCTDYINAVFVDGHTQVGAKIVQKSTKNIKLCSVSGK